MLGVRTRSRSRSMQKVSIASICASTCLPRICGGATSNFVANDADSLDLDLDHITRRHRLRLTRCAGENDVTGNKRDKLRNVTDDRRNVEQQVAGALRLP